MDRQTADGFVVTVHYTASATFSTVGMDGMDITHHASTYGTVGFTKQSGEMYTPYADLTQEQVLGWIWANGVDKEATEASLAGQIDKQKNPVTAHGLPWTPEVQDA
jgi:hypothetical protein